MNSITYQWGTCMDRVCHAPATVPQFTRKLTDLREGESQPRWYCGTHSNKHPNVSPVNGAPIHKQHKAYLKKEGVFVPLKRVNRSEGGDNGNKVKEATG